MRLRDLVSRQGIDSFNAEDFRFVTSKVADDPSRLILVGGQAIEVWGVLFDVPSPIGDHQPLTEDTDWLGGKLDAKWLCDRLGSPSDVDLQFAGDFESSPSSALAYLRRGNRILLMDFLRMIVGPTPEAVHKLAVQVELETGAVICVMHPLLCLESRFANISVIPAKRNGNGPMQAEWSISITKAFLRRMVEEKTDPEQVKKACRQIENLAVSKYGRYCYKFFQLDPMKSVPDEAVAYVGGMFETKDWPIRMERVRSKQMHWAEIASRTMQQIKNTKSSTLTLLQPER